MRARWIIPILLIAGCSTGAKIEIPAPREARLSEASSFAVMDAQSGKWLALENGDLPVVPASAIKVLSTYAALKLLGTDFTFHTDLLMSGNVSQGLLRGNLILRGGGDPFLSSSDLLNIAEQLRRAGVREIKGAFYVDAGNIIPASQISSEVEGDEPYNSPVTALNVDFNQYSNDDGVRRPVTDPPQHAARRFAQFARALRIKIPDPTLLPESFKKARTQVLYRHRSIPLAQGVRSTLEYSNNLLAEAFCLAAARKQLNRPVGMTDGAFVVRDYLSHRFSEVLALDQWKLENCSGLGMGTRITAKQYVSALRTMIADQELPISFASLLKFTQSDFTAIGKSGGLDYHVSLGGVLLNPKLAPRIYFVHYGNPSLRAQTRSEINRPARKADAQDWARFFRREIQTRLAPFLNDF